MLQIDLLKRTLRLLGFTTLFLFIFMLFDFSVGGERIFGLYSIRNFIYLLSLLGFSFCFWFISYKENRTWFFQKSSREWSLRQVRLFTIVTILIILIIYPLLRLIIVEQNWSFRYRFIIDSICLLYIFAISIILHRQRKLLHSFQFDWLKWFVPILFLYHLMFILLFIGDVPSIYNIEEASTIVDSRLNAKNFGTLASARPLERNLFELDK